MLSHKLNVHRGLLLQVTCKNFQFPFPLHRVIHSYWRQIIIKLPYLTLFQLFLFSVYSFQPHSSSQFLTSFLFKRVHCQRIWAGLFSLHGFVDSRNILEQCPPLPGSDSVFKAEEKVFGCRKLYAGFFFIYMHMFCLTKVGLRLWSWGLQLFLLRRVCRIPGFEPLGTDWVWNLLLSEKKRQESISDLKVSFVNPWNYGGWIFKVSLHPLKHGGFRSFSLEKAQRSFFRGGEEGKV